MRQVILIDDDGRQYDITSQVRELMNQGFMPRQEVRQQQAPYGREMRQQMPQGAPMMDRPMPQVPRGARPMPMGVPMPQGRPMPMGGMPMPQGAPMMGRPMPMGAMPMRPGEEPMTDEQFMGENIIPVPCDEYGRPMTDFPEGMEFNPHRPGEPRFAQRNIEMNRQDFGHYHNDGRVPAASQRSQYYRNRSNDTWRH